jgi:hypothetical protein
MKKIYFLTVNNLTSFKIAYPHGSHFRFLQTSNISGTNTITIDNDLARQRSINLEIGTEKTINLRCKNEMLSSYRRS